MVALLHAFFAAAPLAAIALALALGYLLGKLRFGTFVLGPVAATLLVAIAFGQVGVTVSPEVKTLAFALFIYALGYMIGPQFVSSLGRATLKQAHLTLVSSVVVVISVHPVILCGSLCGRQASTPAINAVALAANSNVPVLGYTVPYTVANVLLPLAGPAIVLIV